MAQIRKARKILDQTTVETPQGPLEVAPEAPEADLAELEEHTSSEEAQRYSPPIQGFNESHKAHEDFTIISDRGPVHTQFKDGVRQKYKLPTGSTRIDN